MITAAAAKPQGPEDREYGPGSLPPSSNVGLTPELTAGSGLAMATVASSGPVVALERLDVPSGRPRIASVEHGVFLLPEKGCANMRERR